MKPPIFVRTLSEEERNRLEAGLRSKDTFTLRRSQILLASSRGDETPQIATNLGSVDALVAKSSRAKRIHAAFDQRSAEALREMLHRSPREFGHDSSFWTLEMAAQVALQEGLIEKRVSGETIRATLARLLRVRWQRAKRWITSPDPLDERKKAARPTDDDGRGQSRNLGGGLL